MLREFKIIFEFPELNSIESVEFADDYFLVISIFKVTKISILHNLWNL